MKRAIGLLLLLFAGWLLASSGARLPRVVQQPVSVSQQACPAASAVEHVVEQVAPLRVMRSPWFARLPVLAPELKRGRSRLLHQCSSRAPDLRADLRRVQTRRGVPRLGAEEPPWFALGAC